MVGSTVLIASLRIKGEREREREREKKDITPKCMCASSRNFKQSLATRSSAGSPASERAMIDAGASGHAGRTVEGWGQGTGC